MNGIGFAAPALAAAAAAAVALPVLIHLLLRRRRAPVEWAAMELLREALRRVERRRRVERWLLLAVRCALVLVAGLAIAAPFVGGATAGLRAARTLVAVVDDSVASGERLAEGTALERSVAAVRTAIGQLAPGDRVAVVPLSRAGLVARGEPASLDHRAALSQLESLASSELPGDLGAGLEAAAALLAAEGPGGGSREILVASAFRAGTVGELAPLSRVGSDAAPVRLLATQPPEPRGANAQLALLEPLRSPAGDAQAVVRARIVRDRGEGAQRTTLRVVGPTLTAPVERALELRAGERERIVDLPIAERPGTPADALRRAVVASLSPDAQPADDQRASVLTPAERLRVAVVDRRSFDARAGIDRLPAGEWIARALAPGESAGVEVAQADPAALDARTVAGVDAVVVAQPQLLTPAQWETLTDFVRRGGTLALLPSAQERPQPWMGQLRALFGIPWNCGLEAQELPAPVALAAEQPGARLFSAIAPELGQLAPGVEVTRLVRIDPGSDAAAVQLALADGSPVLLSWRPPEARGLVALFAVAPDLQWTTLPLKPLMVPLWQELVAEGRRAAAAARTIAVGTRPDVDRPGIVELRPVAPDGGALAGARAIAVGAGGRASASIERAGLYEMVDADGRVQGMLAAVVDDRASSVAPVDPARLRAWLAGAGECAWIDPATGAASESAGSAATAAARAGGASLAPPLFMLALLLAVAEAFLARRFSHAVRTSAPVRAAPRVAAGGAR
ncbi:MAG: BatA domain-containing protein [Phycisphaerales bacterium]